MFANMGDGLQQDGPPCGLTMKVACGWFGRCSLTLSKGEGYLLLKVVRGDLLLGVSFCVEWGGILGLG